MEQRAITQMEKSKKMAKADEKFRQAQAQYAKAVKDENDRIRKIQDTAELQKLYLNDSAKGFGLGYELIEFIEDKLREAGYKQSYLETHDNLQAAIHIYGKCGYKEIERPKEVVHSTMNRFFLKVL